MPKRRKRLKRKKSIVVPFGDFDKDLTQDIVDVAPFDKKRKGKVI